MSLDPRDTLRLDGAASAGLEGLVPADRYAVARPHVARAPAATIRGGPSADAVAVDELLFGEDFAVLETRDGHAFGQAGRDGYVGWVEEGALAAATAAPTHRVAALRTPVFAEADIKSALAAMLSMNALVVVGETREDRFAYVPGLGWAPLRHLAPIGEGFAADPAAQAERFLGAPYVWGGRSSLGLDCSGLVQQALYACGRACPRDTDQQRAMGAPVERAGLVRGDLAFWRGHVGIMLDAHRLLHANAHHMAVTIEPLADALARIAEAGGGEASFRRP